MFKIPSRYREYRPYEPSDKQAKTKKFSAPMLVIDENNELVVKKEA